MRLQEVRPQKATHNKARQEKEQIPKETNHLKDQKKPAEKGY